MNFFSGTKSSFFFSFWRGKKSRFAWLGVRIGDVGRNVNGEGFSADSFCVMCLISHAKGFTILNHLTNCIFFYGISCMVNCRKTGTCSVSTLQWLVPAFTSLAEKLSTTTSTRSKLWWPKNDGENHTSTALLLCYTHCVWLCLTFFFISFSYFIVGIATDLGSIK